MANLTEPDAIASRSSARLSLVSASHLVGKATLGELVGFHQPNHIARGHVHGAVPTRIVRDSELSNESEDRRRSAPLSIVSEQVAVTGDVPPRSVRPGARPPSDRPTLPKVAY
jgi:hypothetical protein